MQPIISADGLGKCYWISERRAAYTTLRDLLADTVRASVAGRRRVAGEAIWALKDVSFDIAPGSVTGIVGRNGAGKSTLLKLLSRITPPTVGRAVLRGRIASLLEIGTGFHFELTGRQNVFLNGAILGMTRREIERNFDAIVSFAEVERFIDTPVKFYSTGMYLRLGFAVAAHLEAEIMAVDEVLAVGDVLFQRKYMAKMTEVAHMGRTVLLVSHNMAAIQAMSDEVLLLEGGQLVDRGRPSDVLSAYMGRLEAADASGVSSDLLTLQRTMGHEPCFSEGFLNGRPLMARHAMMAGDDLAVELVIDLSQARRLCFVGINMEDEFGARVWSLHSRWQTPRFDLAAGRHRVTCLARRLPLVPGIYHLGLELGSGPSRIDAVDRVASLQIVERDLHRSGEVPRREHGYVMSPSEWTVSHVNAHATIASGRER